MYLTRFRARSCKLLRDFEVSFVNADGSPRMWTVLVGENGLCKTTLLRAIAMTALGRDFSNNLVDDVPAYLDKRSPDAPLRLRAEYAFSTRSRDARKYPGAPAGEVPVALSSVIGSEPRRASLQGGSHYFALDHRSPSYLSPTELAAADAAYLAEWGMSRADGEEMNWSVGLLDDVVDQARSQGLPRWFVAGYGVGRVLATPRSNVVGPVPVRDRVRSLFDAGHLPIGTGFADHFGEVRARAFADTLRIALCERMLVPKLEDIELRGYGGVSNTSRLIESHRFTMRVGTQELRLPAVWLSQGYQNVISLVADIIGHAWLEADAELALDDIEGLVLVDELDLHLHPIWQTQIVGSLKRAFPQLQFVATTHSPMVLAGCRQDEVWQLREDPTTGDVSAAPAQLAPTLLTAAELYREFFDLHRGQAADLGLRLQRYLQIASDPNRDDREDAELVTLREHLARNLVDVDYEPVVRR